MAEVPDVLLDLVEDGVFGMAKTGLPVRLALDSWRSTRMVAKSTSTRSRVSPRISPRRIPAPAASVTKSR
jgi:hypothetical protein